MEKLFNFHFFQSSNVSDCDAVKENFIIRIKEFELIRYDLENDPMKESVQHYLILGRRGSGKSTLLKRIECEIKTVDSLNKRYEVLNFAEEQGSIHRLFDLFEEIIKVLSDLGYSGLPDTDSFQIPANYAEYARDLFGFIQKAIREKGKKLVLLLDNIDKVFLNIKEDAQIFREILLNYDDLKIIGGSTRMSEHFWQYDLPFYQFFRVLRLEALTTPEIKKLLLRWSEILENKEIEKFINSKPGQIEAIRILTDGLPRTLQFFIDILVNRPQQNGFDYIRRIMDIITPLYQERLHSLTPIEQKIVMKLAFAWEAVAIKDLVQPTKIESKLLSANLKQLANNGIVDIVQTRKKNHLYRLSERFFNMWLIVTQGNPAEKRKAKWLTIFIENWYDKKDLKQIVKQHLAGLEAGILKADHAVVMTKALSLCRYVGFGERDLMIEKSHRLVGENNLLEKELPEKSIDILKRIISYIESKDFKHALIEAKNIPNEEDGKKEWIIGIIHSLVFESEDAEKNFKKSIVKGENGSIYLLALLYDIQKKFELAEKYYLMAIEKGDADAMFNLALLYDNQEKCELAGKYYLMAIEKGNIKAMNNLALLYSSQGKYELEEKYYLMAVEKGSEKAMNNLALLHYNQENHKIAEKYYLMAVEKGDADAMFNLALLYDNQEKFELAGKYYLMAIEKGNIKAMNNLALLYSSQGKYELAEKYYLMAVKKGSEKAMNNLALLYYNQENHEMAEKYHLMAIEKGDADAMFNLAFLYDIQKKFELAEKYYLLAIEKGDENAMNNLALLYDNQGKFELAEKHYLKAVEKDYENAMFNLALFYHNQGKFDLAEKYFLLAIEKGVDKALYNICLMYYLNIKDKSKLNKNYPLIKKNSPDERQLVILSEIWNGIFTNTKTDIEKLNGEENGFDQMFLTHLLVHFQKNIVWELFNKPETGQQLKDKFLPVYYATASLINTEESLSVMLKMPPEIEETVKDILSEIEKLRKEYYPASN